MPEWKLTDTVVGSFASIPHAFLEAALIALLYVVGAVIYVAIFRRASGEGRTGLKSIFGHVLRRDLFAHPSSRMDMGNYALSLLLWLPLMRVVITTVATFLTLKAVYELLGATFGQTQAAIAPGAVIPVQVVILFLCAEFGSYWAHCALHRIPLLWSIHRVHHSAEALTIFTRLRDHPLDFIWMGFGRVAGGALVAGLLFYLLGTPMEPGSMATYLAISTVALPFGFDVWRHSHLPISLGPLNYILGAPVLHQIHHSAEPRHRDKNLGAELAIFDWMFGTLYIPEKDEAYRWGLNEAERGDANPHRTLRDFYCEPFRYARRLLRGERAGLAQPAASPTGDTAARPDLPATLEKSIS
jgi:sterol desaturase/sphingolipid hydroxylase (fatty acid hydroxylase superfamily)